MKLDGDGEGASLHPPSQVSYQFAADYAVPALMFFVLSFHKGHREPAAPGR